MMETKVVGRVAEIRPGGRLAAEEGRTSGERSGWNVLDRVARRLAHRAKPSCELRM